jgi:hypothetical protein
MINNWSVEVQLFCVLKECLTIGVLRPSELINCLITDCDGDDNTNYINVVKAGVSMQKQMEKKDISNEVVDVVMHEPVM